MYLSTEVELHGLAGSADALPGPVSPQNALLTSMTQWWTTNALQPYLALSGVAKLPPLTLQRRFLGRQVSFTLRFDANLLSDLFETYATYGWSALDQIEELLSELPRAYKADRGLFRAARAVVAVMVEHALVQLEDQAVAYARARWSESRKRIQQWLDKFTVHRLALEHPTLTDRDTADQLLAACRRYALIRAEVLALQTKIDERNRIVAPSRRRPGSGAALWFEIYAKPQRELLSKLTAELTAINALFPPAVLVLDTLPEDILDDSSPLRRAKGATALAKHLYFTIKGLAADTDQLIASLRAPATTAASPGRLLPLISGDLSGLSNWAVSQDGPDGETLDLVMARTADGDQRVLADLDLLLSLLDDEELVERGTWNQAVLFQFCQRLAAEIDARKENDAWWAGFWRWVERITAALALIGLMLVFPFGEAAAPALVAALSLAGTTAAIAGVVTLVLHHFIGSWVQAGKLDQEVGNRLFRIGQDDPEAIIEIGEALGRSAALRRAVQEGAVLTLLTLGAAHRLKAISVALEFKGFAEDVETLFAPVDTTAEGDETREQAGEGRHR